MRWSFQAIGSTQQVLDALEAHADKISVKPDDPARLAFAAAQPHLAALVQHNFAEEGHGQPSVQLSASSGGTILKGDDEKPRLAQSSLSLELRAHW